MLNGNGNGLVDRCDQALLVGEFVRGQKNNLGVELGNRNIYNY